MITRCRSWGVLTLDHLTRANQLAEVGRTSDAIRVVESGLAQDPENADLHGMRADLCVRVRQFDQAWESLGIAMQARPEDARLYCVYARFLLKRDDVSGAQWAAGRALALDPDEIESWWLATLAHVAGNDRPGAMSLAKATRARFPGSPIGYLAIAHAELVGVRPPLRAGWLALVLIAPASVFVMPFIMLMNRLRLRRADIAVNRALELDAGNTTAFDLRAEIGRLGLSRRESVVRDHQAAGVKPSIVDPGRTAGQVSIIGIRSSVLFAVVWLALLLASDGADMWPVAWLCAALFAGFVAWLVRSTESLRAVCSPIIRAKADANGGVAAVSVGVSALTIVFLRSIPGRAHLLPMVLAGVALSVPLAVVSVSRWMRSRRATGFGSRRRARSSEDGR